MVEGIKAGGLLYIPEGLVLVSRHGSGRDGLVIPKGSIESTDDTMRRTAEREVLEETGYVATAAMFLGTVVRASIDVDSPEQRKVINLYLMDGDGTRDPGIVPDELVRVVNPHEAANGGLMRYPEEAQFISRHLGTLLKVHGW